MKYAVIALNGKQFKVAEGDTLTLDAVKTPEGNTITVDEVLLMADGEQVSVGTPFVENASVSLRVTEHAKDKKIEVRRFKAKSRYRRNRGHRQPISSLVVESVSAGPPKKKATTEE